MDAPLTKLLRFLNRLDEGKIPYYLRHSREDAVMVVCYAPGEYWEVDFLVDGTVDIEIYRSDGRIHGEETLRDLLEKWRE
ncbi:MAG TPA: hypothetical protein VG013_42120 [Gemmataceae bacterium]|jgi:hypothetical protein|nr:hypothetical protein [Gemmataceae bacterium]